MSREPRVAPEAAQPPLVVALDLGTSSHRAALFDAAGRLIDGTLQRAKVAWTPGADGAVETDGERLVELSCSLIDRLVHSWPELAAGARLGVVSTAFHSFVGVDAARRPVTPLLSWADTRAASSARRLAGLLDPAATHERTGAPIHPGYWPARIASSRGQDHAVAGWAGLPELMLHRLTGRWTIGLSIAGGTGLLDRRGRAWDERLLGALGLEPAALPGLHTALEPVGRLTHDAAVRWPALSHVEWLAPIGDGACGNVGLGAVGWERAALMVGTSSALRLLVPGDPPTAEGLFAYPLEGVGTLLGGALSEGGGTLEWWGDIVGERLEDGAGRTAAGPGSGIAALPYLAGERGPGFRPDASLVLVGLRSGHGADDVLRTLLDAIAVSLAEIHERLARLAPAAFRIIAGGGALNAYKGWAQTVCDALGRPMDVSWVSEPSLHGAAVLALHSAGLLPLDGDTPTAGRLNPDLARSAELAALRGRRRRLYAALYDADAAD